MMQRLKPPFLPGVVDIPMMRTVTVLVTVSVAVAGVEVGVEVGVKGPGGGAAVRQSSH